MSAISGTLNFVPTLPNGSLSVSGNTFTDVKQDALNKVATQRNAATTNAAACDAATAALNS